ncbi:hypothetical protein D3C85_1033340 [compost metagenome]
MAADRQRQTRSRCIAQARRRAGAAGVHGTDGCAANRAGGDLARRAQARARRHRRQLLRTGRRLDHLDPGGQPSASGRDSHHPAGPVPAPDRAEPGEGRGTQRRVGHRPGAGAWRGAADADPALVLRAGHRGPSPLEPVAAAGTARAAGQRQPATGLGRAGRTSRRVASAVASGRRRLATGPGRAVEQRRGAVAAPGRQCR